MLTLKEERRDLLEDCLCWPGFDGFYGAAMDETTFCGSVVADAALLMTGN